MLLTGTITFSGYLSSDSNITGYSKEEEEVSNKENEDSGAIKSKHFSYTYRQIFVKKVVLFEK